MPKYVVLKNLNEENVTPVTNITAVQGLGSELNRRVTVDQVNSMISHVQGVDNAVLFTEQNLNSEQQNQARLNIGAQSEISINNKLSYNLLEDVPENQICECRVQNPPIEEFSNYPERNTANAFRVGIPVLRDLCNGKYLRLSFNELLSHSETINYATVLSVSTNGVWFIYETKLYKLSYNIELDENDETVYTYNLNIYPEILDKSSVIIVSDVENLTNSEIESIKLGDVVIDPNYNVAFNVNWKDDSYLQLFTVDCNIITTIEYNKINNVWTSDGFINNQITQSDWNQSNSSAIDYIKNKPTINNILFAESIIELTSEQVEGLNVGDVVVVSKNNNSAMYNVVNAYGNYKFLSLSCGKDSRLVGYLKSDNTWSYWRTQDYDLVNYELKENKVTSISSNSTNTQYPSAKCVYDTLLAKQNIIDSEHKLDYSLISNAPIELADLSNVDSTTPTNGQVLTYDNVLNKWKPSTVQGGNSSSSDSVLYTQQNLTDVQKTQARTNIGAGTYSKPINGIPASDLVSEVQASLGKADGAVRFDATQSLNSIQKDQARTNIGVEGQTLVTSLEIAPDAFSNYSENAAKEALGMSTGELNGLLSGKYGAVQFGLKIYNVLGTGLEGMVGQYASASSDVLLYGSGTYYYLFYTDGIGYSLEETTKNPVNAYVKPSGGIPKTDLASGVVPETLQMTIPANGSYDGTQFATATGITLDDFQDILAGKYGWIEKIPEAGAIGGGTIRMPVIISNSSYMDYVYIIDNGTVYSIGREPGNYFTVSHRSWVIPTISTNVQTDKASNNMTSSPKSVYDEVHPAVVSSQPAGGMLPNVFYNLGTLSGDTTFAFASATDNTIENEWMFQFTTPSTAPTITWPQAITGWAGGSAPTINASKTYQVSVVNGLGVIVEF